MDIQKLYNNFFIKYNAQTQKINYKKIINKRFQELGLWDLIQSKNNILELGCGSGNLTELISRYTNKKMLCIDFSKNMLSILEEWIKENNKRNISTLMLDVNDISNINNEFDLIISSGMIEYVNFRTLLRDIRKLLNPEGQLIFLISRNTVLNWFVVKLYWKAKIYSEIEILQVLEEENYKNIEIYDLSDKYFENWYYIVKCSL